MTEGLFVHCVCLKSLASYLYTDLDDEFNECPSASSTLDAFSSGKTQSVDSQSFCVSFVEYFRRNYVERKRQFYHLSVQFVHFMTQLYSAFPSSLLPIPFHNGDRTCTYCHGASHFLVKCQHKNCPVFCHFACYLQHTHDCCFHVMLKGASVSLLFYCNDHHAEGVQLAEEDAKNAPEVVPANTRSTNRSKEAIQRCKEAISALTWGNLESAVLPQESIFSLQMQNYQNWLELDAVRTRCLSWSSKRFQLEGNHNDGPYVVNDIVKGDVCAICRDEVSKEIFPRLLSHVHKCAKCGAVAHDYCEAVTPTDGWTCSKCREALSSNKEEKSSSNGGTPSPNKEDNSSQNGEDNSSSNKDNPSPIREARCSFCQKQDGYLLNVSHALCHLGCYIRSRCSAPDEVCEHCTDNHCVFRCCVKGCDYRSHYCCGEGRGDCAFGVFSPASSRLSFFYVCSMHIHTMSVQDVVANATPYSLSLAAATPDRFLLSFFHPLRSVLSLSSVRVYNNSPAFQKLRSVFVRAGCVDSPAKKRRMKAESKRESKEKEHRKETKETRRRQRGVSTSAEETPAPTSQPVST